MGTITSTIYKDRDLTILHIHGAVTDAEVLRYVGQLHDGDTTRYVVWDFEHGDATSLVPGKMRTLDPTFKDFADARKNGRTAFVFFRDVDFGYGRMIESYLDLIGYPLEVKSFRSFEAAYAWLGIEPPPADASSP